MPKLDIYLSAGPIITAAHPERVVVEDIRTQWTNNHSNAGFLVNEILVSAGWDVDVSFRAVDAVALTITD